MLIPLIHNKNADTPIFLFDDKIVTAKRFKQDISTGLEYFSQHKYTINLCEDRYLFTIAFITTIIQKNICLLPANRTEKEIEYLEKEFNDSQRINDDDIKKLLNNKISDLKWPNEIDADQQVAIIFTSGSSGKPKANYKNWGSLCDSAQRVFNQLNLNAIKEQTIIVATVPPQHMYGFEMTIMLPLVNNICAHNLRPFFPEDIRETLNKQKQPTLLITTPIHLRACANANIVWPNNIHFIISATAPLCTELAKNIEHKLKTTINEIYGCTETGVIATRVTTQNLNWKILKDYSLTRTVTGTCLSAPTFNEDILLPDQIEKIDNKYFKLIGRQSDLIKVAGKRGSLNDLKIKLCSIEGVEDAVFFIPDGQEENCRLAAFVVAPSLSVKDIANAFKQEVDNAFVPRPLIKVDALPYSELGKLPLKKIVELYNTHHNQLKAPHKTA